MEYLVGCVIAMFIALTGVGAGTITTPLLIVFFSVPTPVAVSTGLLFSAAVKLVLVPPILIRRQVNWRVLGYMTLGGLPGVLLGSLWLHHLAANGPVRLMNGVLGVVLVLTALYQIAFSFRTPKPAGSAPDRARWLPLLMFPVGAEVGFSAAGAGALGTAALLSLTALEPLQVVGTDILFGFVLSLAGGGAHLASGAVEPELLKRLIVGGLAGVGTGIWASRYVPRRPLRFALWLWLLLLGGQFVYKNVLAHWLMGTR